MKAVISCTLRARESPHGINDLCAASSEVPEAGLASRKEEGKDWHSFTRVLMPHGKLNL